MRSPRLDVERLHDEVRHVECSRTDTAALPVDERDRSVDGAEEQVVGVIGTSCSGAGAAASELLSEAGLVMISPSNTSPSLTSDLEGNENANYYPGYFRLSNNDIYTGRAAAAFVYEEMNLRKMGTVDIDDAYIAGLVDAFCRTRRASTSRINGAATTKTTSVTLIIGFLLQGGMVCEERRIAGRV